MEKAGSGQYLIGGVRDSKAGVDIECLSPLSNDLNLYQSALARSNSIKDYDADENLISVVLRLRYAGNSILLSSDAPKKAWPAIWKKARKKQEPFSAEVVKVSHHGSASGHHNGIWVHTLSAKGTHGAISSGVRYGHPHAEVIHDLHGLGVQLHCTNYPEICQKNRYIDMSKFRGLSSAQRLGLLMLDKSSNRPSSPCNGDILFELGPDGTYRVQNQYDNFCPFHLVAA
jgi:hypothetical protein